MSDQEATKKKWFTVELPQHAKWECQAKDPEEAKRKFIEWAQVNETDHEYAVTEGRLPKK
jgi:hypothetical protein